MPIYSWRGMIVSIVHERCPNLPTRNKHPGDRGEMYATTDSTANLVEMRGGRGEFEPPRGEDPPGGMSKAGQY